MPIRMQKSTKFNLLHNSTFIITLPFSLHLRLGCIRLQKNLQNKPFNSINKELTLLGLTIIQGFFDKLTFMSIVKLFCITNISFKGFNAIG